MKKISNATDTKEIAVTIYNGGFGAIKEIRRVNLVGTETELTYADVAQRIETDSLMVEGIKIIEFNYDYDLVSKDKLLGKYIDKEVFLKNRTTGEKKSYRLLSVEGNGKCVLEDRETKEIYIDPQEEMVLPSLPAGLIVKPALVWKIIGSQVEDVKVSYLSEGFNWKSNYVIEIMEKTLNIAGWAEIENQSGATFENVKLKLISGDVNRVEEDNYNVDYSVIKYSMMEDMASPQVEEKSFFDYHMYTMNNLTTLKNNQSKQINIINGYKVPYKKYYKLDFNMDKTNVVIEFPNKKEAGLGIPLPKGNIKLYKADEADNSLEFIGEDKIEHTPKDEEIKLVIGNAFDITYKFIELDRRKLNGYDHFKYECTIKNHKDEFVDVRFEHYVWGIWEMVFASHKNDKKASGLIEFFVNVPPQDDVKVLFEYKIDRRPEVVIKK